MFELVKEDTVPDQDEIKQAVRDRYATWATGGTPCCGADPVGGSDSCGCSSEGLGYDLDEIAALPDGVDLGLGCGNPLAFASLREGETVLDLGSGPGLDCLLAAKRVGPDGHVIGVDMTPEMIARAEANATKIGTTNVDFRLGNLESLPVESCSVDAIISNCVINLVPDKLAAFREALRVLKPGGRLEVSDIVLTGPLPEGYEDDMDAYVACLAGAIPKTEYLALLFGAGFAWVGVQSETTYGAEDSPFASVHVSALKGDASPGC
jgi:arsenite methyltransferase